MKKIYIYFMVLAAVSVAMLAISCVRELDYRPAIGGQAVIRLTPVCCDPTTKADTEPTEPGNNTYNENKIDGYYWFICGDAAGNSILLGGYTAGSVDTERPIDSNFPIRSGEGWVYVIANLPVKPESPVAGDEWFEYDATVKGIKHVIQGGSTTTYSGSVANLKKIPFGKGMPTTYPNRSEFYKYTSATTGVPEPDRFVMRTEAPVPFTVPANSGVEVTAELKRVAAKIILDLYVAETVVQTQTQPTGLEQYVKTWDSDMSHIQIYMLWGSTHSTIAGTPIAYGGENVDPKWFYPASPRYAMYTNPVGGRFNGTNVEGSVPSNLYSPVDKQIESTVWEIVYEREWIWNPDVPEEDRILNNQDDAHGQWGDYRLDDQGQKIPVIGADGNVQRQPSIKTETKRYYHILSLPLYTMPISWNVSDAHAPFIKVILPWQGYDTTKDPVKYDSSTTEFYYKVLIPELTELDANGCYHIQLDLSVLGSTADEVPVEITGEYHVVDWNEPIQAMGGDQTAGRYLDCGTYFEFYSVEEMEIPIRSSHGIEIVGTPTATYQDYSGDEAETTLLPTDTYSITASGNNKVTLNHTLDNNLSTMNAYDVSPITYTFTIQHKGEGGSAYQKTITVVQYPSIYIEDDPNSGASETHVLIATLSIGGYYTTTVRHYSTKVNNQGRYSAGWYDNDEPDFYDDYSGQRYYLDEYACGYTFVNTIPHTTTTTVQNYGYTYTYTYEGDHNFEPPVTGPNDWTKTGGLVHSNNTNSNMYVITTKVLSDESQVIGDPRTDAGSAITDYDGWVTAPGYEGSTGRTLQAYKQANNSDDAENMIAPKLRTASSFGATSDFSYDDATRRCAGYQEDGLPAGRWRLPTSAEIAFLVNLSARHFLPRLFGSETGSTDYWSANGYVTVNNENNTVDPHPGDTSGNHFIRCVYDEWYWEGKRLEPSKRNTFTWGDEIN